MYLFGFMVICLFLVLAYRAFLNTRVSTNSRASAPALEVAAPALQVTFAPSPTGTPCSYRASNGEGTKKIVESLVGDSGLNKVTQLSCNGQIQSKEQSVVKNDVCSLIPSDHTKVSCNGPWYGGVNVEEFSELYNGRPDQNPYGLHYISEQFLNNAELSGAPLGSSYLARQLLRICKGALSYDPSSLSDCSFQTVIKADAVSEIGNYLSICHVFKTMEEASNWLNRLTQLEEGSYAPPLEDIKTLGIASLANSSFTVDELQAKSCSNKLGSKDNLPKKKATQ